MEAVHVELSDEGVHFIVSKVFGKDNSLEFVDILDDKLSSGGGPVCNFGELLIL